MPERLILATGFSIFPGAPENPTEWAMHALERTAWQPQGARLVTRTLPVRFDLWESELRPLLVSTRPDAVVAFGLSAKAGGLTLESTARNVVAADRPDVTGTAATSTMVSEAGPAILPTRLPLRDITTALLSQNIPMSRSDDAGDYLCNLLFYKLLEFADAGGPKIAGFVHVPYLDTQAARLAATGLPLAHVSTVTEDQLIRGIKAVVSACVGALMRQAA